MNDDMSEGIFEIVWVTPRVFQMTEKNHWCGAGFHRKKYCKHLQRGKGVPLRVEVYTEKRGRNQEVRYPDEVGTLVGIVCDDCVGCRPMEVQR